MNGERHPWRHGTETSYVRGCRCHECRTANTEAVRRRRARKAAEYADLFSDVPGVQCRCGHRLVPCDGAFGDWMHKDTRREVCADGVVALPVEKAWRGAGV